MDEVVERYTKALALLVAAQGHSGSASEKARARANELFVAKELDGFPIGHARGGGTGNGIGPKRAEKLLALAEDLLQHGLHDPNLFEAFSVVEKGFGADLISDLIAHTIQEKLFAFSERVANELDLPTRPIETDVRTYYLPWNPIGEKRLVLPPHDSVADIASFGRSKRFDSTAFGNKGIRQAFDKIVKERGMAGIRAFAAQSQEIRTTLLKAYQGAAPAPHDVYQGPAGPALGGRAVYEAIAQRFGGRRQPPADAHALFAAVVRLAEEFKDAAEAGVLRRQLHSPTGPRSELDVHSTFATFVRLVCNDMDVKVSPESDAGVGPADFIFDRGASAVVVLEVKLSSSKKLLPNYDYQVSAYRKSHGAHHGIYMVLDLANKPQMVGKLVEHHHGRHSDRSRPYLVIIDGRETKPASKRGGIQEPLARVCSQPRVEPPRNGDGVTLAAEQVVPADPPSAGG